MNTLQLATTTLINGKADVKKILFSNAALLPSARYYDGVTQYDDLEISAQGFLKINPVLTARVAISAYIKSYIVEFFFMSGVLKVNGLNYSNATNASGLFKCSASKLMYAEETSTVAEVLASGTLTVTGGTASSGVNKLTAFTVNGVSLIGAAVDWITSNNQTATNIATAMNTTGVVTAVAVGAVVTYTFLAGTGSTPNGGTIVKTQGGNFTATTTAISGGVDFVGDSTFVFGEATQDGVYDCTSLTVPNKTIVQVMELASVNSTLVAIATSSIQTSFPALTPVTGV